MKIFYKIVGDIFFNLASYWPLQLKRISWTVKRRSYSKYSKIAFVAFFGQLNSVCYLSIFISQVVKNLFIISLNLTYYLKKSSFIYCLEYMQCLNFGVNYILFFYGLVQNYFCFLWLKMYHLISCYFFSLSLNCHAIFYI